MSNLIRVLMVEDSEDDALLRLRIAEEGGAKSAIRNKVGYSFNVFNSLALSFRLVTARMTTVPGRMR